MMGRHGDRPLQLQTLDLPQKLTSQFKEKETLNRTPGNTPIRWRMINEK